MAAERLRGATALVTGASRGIGWACADALARAGVRVLMLARDAAALEHRARELATPGETFACDLSDPVALRRCVHEVRARLTAAPDIVVNSAGQFMIAPVENTTLAEFQAIVGVNVTAPFAFMREFLPDMRDRGRGHVVTIGSLADHEALAGNSAYAASKFGVRALHEVVRAELRGTGIRTTLISPTHVATSIWDAIDPAERPEATGSGLLNPRTVADAMLYALLAPPEVNVDEIRLSHS